MALKQAADRAIAAQLILGAGVASLVLVLTFRRLRGDRRRGPRDKPKVSSRSEELTRGSTPVHILEHIARLADPDYVCLSIAENKLTVGPLVEKLLELDARLKAPLPPDPGALQPGPDSNHFAYQKTESAPAVTSSEQSGGRIDDKSAAAVGMAARKVSMGYGDPRGPQWVRRELASMMEKHMFHREVDPENLCVAAGTKAVLRLLMVTLTEEGQGCLIPAPYFTGFDEVLISAGVKAWAARDVATVGGCMEAGVDAGISPRALEASLREANSADIDIRVILITSPHNPTGRLYSAKALTAAIAWARKRELHVVVDEIYANSVHRPHAVFRSVGSLDSEGCSMGDDVHVVYGLSKDFGVAGWRVGILYSENREVTATVSKMIHTTSQSSSETMDRVGRLLREPGFLDEYLAQHQETLRAAYMSLVNELGRRGILHLQAEAGIFAMVDLREFLEDPSPEAEARLWRDMLEQAGVNLTPGESLHCPEPGWFRLCFAYQNIDVVVRSVARMADFLQEGLLTERKARRTLPAQQPGDEVVGASSRPAAAVTAPAVDAVASESPEAVLARAAEPSLMGGDRAVVGRNREGDTEQPGHSDAQPEGGDMERGSPNDGSQESVVFVTDVTPW